MHIEPFLNRNAVFFVEKPKWITENLYAYHKGWNHKFNNPVYKWA